MKDRCNQASHRSYEHYGQRNITYTPDWESYSAFLADMGIKPEGMTLDRIDGTKGYTRQNCRWADAQTQNRNRSNNIRVTLGNRTLVLSEWAELLAVPYNTLYSRIVDLGWDHTRALVIPSQTQGVMTLTHDGRTMTAADWSRETGITSRTIRHRITMGWPVEKALTAPAKPRTKK
ncbi:hypothetical protein AFFFEF_04597 [Methylorubrum extorquens]